MLTIRPIALGDLDVFVALHGRCRIEEARRLVDESQHAFAGHGAMPHRLVFVLVDDDRPFGEDDRPLGHDERLLGVASLAGSTGSDMPRFSYRRGVVVHASAELKLFNRVETLLIGNDHTGCAELTLPLMASTDSRQAPERLLIEAMLLFVAMHPDRFAPTIVCELPGIRASSGGSAFWNGLGRHFHAGDFPADDALFKAPVRSHIARLMPKHPMYTSLIGAEARACIGQRSHAVRVAADALHGQGFRDRGYINLFDGGPVLQAEVADMRRPVGCVAQVTADADPRPGVPWLVAHGAADGFSARLVRAVLEDGALSMAPSTAHAMSLESGDKLACLAQGNIFPKL